MRYAPVVTLQYGANLDPNEVSFKRKTPFSYTDVICLFCLFFMLHFYVPQYGDKAISPGEGVEKEALVQTCVKKTFVQTCQKKLVHTRVNKIVQTCVKKNCQNFCQKNCPNRHDVL